MSKGNQRSRREVARGIAGLLVAVSIVALACPLRVRPAAAADTGLLHATALVVIEDRGCPYCARFDVETRESYEKSAEGRFAPLVRRRRTAGDIAFLKDIVYSPTFVLIVEGREIGRIVGYQGADLFWIEMAGLMRKAGVRPEAGG